MALKRNALEAFGPVSAFAAARQHREAASSALEEHSASEIATEPYEIPHEHENDCQDNTDPVMQNVSSRPIIQLSSVPKGVIREIPGGLEVTLQAKQTITCIGEYDLSVADGLVTVYGSVLCASPSRQRVFALSFAALPSVTALRDGSVVRLSSVSDGSRVTSLESLSPLFRGIGFAGHDTGWSFTVLHSTADDILERSLSPLEVDEDTRKTLSRLNAKLDAQKVTRVMIVGAKSSGKSTLSRLMSNLITSRAGGQRCMYFDLDPGQPEFGPPGQISLVEVTAPLLGPSFTHRAWSQSKGFRLIRSHTIAATSFNDEPDLYLRSVADLASSAAKYAPWVVNTCGWVSGTGEDVIVELLKILSATDVPIMHPVDARLVDVVNSRTLDIMTPHHIRRNRAKIASSRSPPELRAMSTMAYFHSRYNHADDSCNWTRKPINEMRPWVVPYEDNTSGITAVLSYGQVPHPEFLHEVLAGAIVALVVVDPDSADGAHLNETGTKNVLDVFSYINEQTPWPNPRLSHCVGCALVRSIDPHEKKVQLVLPLDKSQVVAQLRNQVVFLVRGSFDCPNWAYLEGVYMDNSEALSAKEKESPWISRSEPAGIESAVWRMRHPPMAMDVRNAQ